MCLYFSCFRECLDTDVKVINTLRDKKDICESLKQSVDVFKLVDVEPLVNFYLEAKNTNLAKYDGPILDICFGGLKDSPKKIADFIGVPLTKEAENFIEV